ncbi:TPA: hypothetical protein NJ373_002709 [Vibrio parahaemolyticus]|uniref:hypothetical protein n=1 Tax=Vibrio parahaemolyticus TaxID=670 RepID=UPI00111EE449|nr:hypothetical protein [Vibrio parahaemolyticus]EGQ7686731.1 hypothetical protein [Vibrio parahaemolyticus]EGQ8184674.1 hypothetical protein [Vibrio parahaemolyticus]EGQ8544971.1 hypothetical protein [Vibrio parahaemolyticus]EKQ5824396.1 hypothetical protein [Vibrio parahaemolyticus]ELB2176292.1 hypothetical protein [Vibrio parahaemolyticus]
MSITLESAAEIIASVNSMTATVAGQSEKIQKQADEATKAVPNAVRAMSEVTFYVSNGGSDLYNDGSKAKPFKTVQFAISQAMSGAMVFIYLEDNQEYICESSVRNNLCNGKNIVLKAYGSSGVKPRMRFKMTQNPEGSFNGAYVCNYFEGSVFSITNDGVDWINDPIPEGGVAYSSDSFGGVITRGSDYGGGIDITLRLANCNITTGDHPFVTGQMGYLNVHARGVNIAKGGSIERFLPLEGLRMARMIGLYAVSISGFTSNAPKDVFQYDETKIASVLGGGL